MGQTVKGATAKFGKNRGSRQRATISMAMAILGAVLFAAVFGPSLAAYAPNEVSLVDQFRSPSQAHLLGTNSMGIDVMAQLLYGARVTVIVGCLGSLLGGGVGVVVGLVAGYAGGLIDATLARCIDIALSLPTILIALLLAVTMGPGYGTVSIAISLVIWARFARVVRGEVLSVKERGYVAQARIVGCSPFRIMGTHIFPNILDTIMVLASLNVGYVILLEATLSFLGAGIPAPAVSWGRMVAEGRDYVASSPLLSAIPGLAIAITVLALNLLGDWLRDALNPKLRQL